MIPNTTQVPNIIFDVWMSKLSGNELKVLLAVVRHTLGWIEDKRTGRRKEKDHISQKQLKQMTGLSAPTIAKAIERLVELGLIEVLTEDGEPLMTPLERQEYGRVHGAPVFRLNTRGLLKNLTSPEEDLVKNFNKGLLKDLTRLVKNFNTSKENIDKEKDKEKNNIGGAQHPPLTASPPSREELPESIDELVKLANQVWRECSPREERRGKKKTIVYPQEWYRVCQKAFEVLKGAPLTQISSCRKALKEAFAAGYSPVQWIECARFCLNGGLEWLDVVSPHTVTKLLPDYVSGRLTTRGKNGKRPKNVVPVDEDLMAELRARDGKRG